MTKTKVTIKVGPLSDLPDEMGKAFFIRGKHVAFFKISDTKVHAIDNRCPHKGGELSHGILSGESVFCPLHDLKVCTKTGSSEEAKCVTTYPVDVIEGDMFITMEEGK